MTIDTLDIWFVIFHCSNLLARILYSSFTSSLAKVTKRVFFYYFPDNIEQKDNLKPNVWFCDNSLGHVNLAFKVGSSLEVNLDFFKNKSEKSLFSKDHNNKTISLYTTIMYQYEEFSIQSRVSKWMLKCWWLMRFLFNYSLKWQE